MGSVRRNRVSDLTDSVRLGRCFESNYELQV